MMELRIRRKRWHKKPPTNSQFAVLSLNVNAAVSLWRFIVMKWCGWGFCPCHELGTSFSVQYAEWLSACHSYWNVCILKRVGTYRTFMYVRIIYMYTVYLMITWWISIRGWFFFSNNFHAVWSTCCQKTMLWSIISACGIVLSGVMSLLTVCCDWYIIYEVCDWRCRCYKQVIGCGV